MIFVTDMDIDNASYRQVVEDLQALYGKKIAPFHLPVGGWPVCRICQCHPAESKAMHR